MKTQGKITLKITLIISLILFCGITSARVIYVDGRALGLNNGSTWENAYIYLQDALADANYSEKPVEIRVAQGIYTPDKGATVTFASFELINNVTISGGYAGHGHDELQEDPNARDIELYETILSGDLLGNDSNEADPNNLVNEPTCFDNSFHVVTGSYTDETTILDGFTIKSGNAGFNYENLDSTSRGGGLYIENGNPVIMNCTFTRNAAYLGGAIYNHMSDPNISDCRFIGNSANYYYFLSPEGGCGGAIYNSQSNPILNNCEFIENLASSGAGIYNSNNSNAVITNCKFSHNTSNLDNGGGICNSSSSPIIKDCNFIENYSSVNGGGISNHNLSCPTVLNCIFTKNQTYIQGGAIYNVEHSDPNIINCTFNENSAYSGGALANENSDPNVIKCIFNNNNAANGGGFCNQYGKPIFNNCIFSDNKANKAGAIINYYGEPELKNCIISGNRAYYSSAIFNIAGDLKATNCTLAGNYAEVLYGLVLNKTSIYIPKDEPGSPVIPGQPVIRRGSIEFLNCIIWNGEKAISNPDDSEIIISYCDLQGGNSSISGSVNYIKWGQGNINSDPLFVKDGCRVDANDPNIILEPDDPNAIWQEGDYHLKSTAGHYDQNDPNSNTWIFDEVNSPCIDAGDPNSPYENEPLPNGGRINMGAYGNTIEASKSAERPVLAHQKLKKNN
jgi:hypothetical protein